jgi:glycine betaine/proline transport system substrate-binding protein
MPRSRLDVDIKLADTESWEITMPFYSAMQFVIALSLAIAAIARPVPGAAGETIRIAVHEWTGQHISAHIAGAVLAKAGYEVEYITAGAIPSFAALANGNLHLQPEVWDNQVAEIFPKAVATGDIVVVGALGLVPREGWVYPPYMEEHCPGLPTAAALIECAQNFATPETHPKGRLVTYPADWGTRSKELVANARLPFEAVAGGSEGAMIAELTAAYAARRPILMMFWAPHWIHARLKLNWVDLPAAHPDCSNDPQHGFAPDATGDCGFAEPKIVKVVWRGFQATWPGAYAIVERLTIDNETQNLLLLEVDEKKRKLEAVIAEWIAGHEDTWRGWLTGQ